MATDIATLVGRNADVFLQVVVNRAAGAHGFIAKYAMSAADETAFERAGYLTDFSSGLYMLTDLGRDLVAQLKTEQIRRLEAMARQWDRNAANAQPSTYLRRSKADVYRGYAKACRTKADRLRNGENVDEDEAA